ncbi:uncharacterized protein C22orf31 [Oreochromis niloticus]|uniref:uncharacterized protein C22orf31 n=1 Tax=Oreochromis niloticus TaxID=8128 RepID=UPI000393F282|nr:uncharacterized protein C22orf31 [Oreochromis niloticus]
MLKILFDTFHTVISSKLSVLLKNIFILMRTKNSQSQKKATSIMENCAAEVQDSLTAKRVSAQLSERRRKPGACRRCQCFKDEQHTQVKRQRSPSADILPQKRRKTKASTSDADDTLTRPSATIPDAELPPVSNTAPNLQPSTVAPRPDSPLKIHNRSVEEYQQVYHEVVDDMLRDENGQLRPYSSELGRLIKKKLWERLNRHTMIMSTDEDGRLHVDVTYGVEECPPEFNVDTTEEPEC